MYVYNDAEAILDGQPRTYHNKSEMFQLETTDLTFDKTK